MPRRPSSTWDRTARWRRSACPPCSAARGRYRHPSRSRRSTRRSERARRRWHGGRRFPDVNGGVVVTGASTGFGAAIARHLAERGFRVFGTVRRAEDEVALARDGVTPVRMDVTDTASIMRARGEVERALGTAPLMALVNNAGIPAAGRRELLPFGVRVIVIEPGSFKTAIWSKVEAMDRRRYAGTPYEGALERFRRASLRGAERAPPPDKVVRAVWRALNARRPPLRVI